jgi:hypothetical protein
MTEEQKVVKHLDNVIRDLEKAVNSMTKVARVQDPNIIQVRVDRIKRYCASLESQMRNP